MKEVEARNETEAFAALLSDAREFLASGGNLSRSEWGDLHPLHRRAFAQAGNEQADRLANSIAYAILERVDGALVEGQMERVLDAVGAA